MTAAEKLIFELVASQKLTPNDAAILLEHQQKHEEPVKEQEIAIIGMAGKFPEGEDLRQFWECLRQQKNGITDFPDSRVRDCIGEALPDEIEVNQLFFKGGYLERIDQFDPSFFQIAPAEAKFMDPLQRLMLEASYQAIEDAGYDYKDLSGTNTGVYIGTDHTWGQWYRDNAAEQDPLLLSGTWSAILSSRISYGLNLKGPSLVVDTSCSSGLVAVHEACRSIQSGVCNLAIAGGIHINYSPVKNPMLDLVESQDSLIRTFDKQANGTVWGEGVGAVILKPLQQAIRDRDHIYGIIKGSAVNNDGTSDGITAPSARAQEEVICQAWQEAGIDPQTISYVEAHGTGTQLGDSIEINGLTKAFSRYTQRKQFCAIGTVKTNIGHTVGASGLASLLKVMLAFHHQRIPASLNFLEVNPFIDFFASPVYVNDRLQDWTTTADTPRVAGISSFGFSGTNCHMIVQEAPDIPKPTHERDQAPLYVLPLSAKDDQVLLRLVEDYTDYISRHAGIDLQDLCYTASTGRGHYNHRLVILFTGYAELLQKLEHLQKHGLASGAEVLCRSHEMVAHGGAMPDQPGPVRLTERDKQILTLQAVRLLQALDSPQEADLALYRSISELYVSGAAIDWKRMYQAVPCRRLNLPVYPFRRTRCWAEKRGQGHPQQHMHLHQASGHPLLRGNVCETSGQVIYTTAFSVATDWVLHEHQIGREYVLPGTAYIELLLEIGRQQGGRSVIKQLAFLQPFSIREEGDTHALQIVVSNGKEDSEFYIESKDQTDGIWRRHAEGKLCPPSRDRRTYDLPALLEAFQIHPKITGVEPSGGYITTGARWNNIKELRVGPEECLVAAGLGDDYREEAAGYHYHPALLDNAVNIAIRSIDDQLYLPFYYQEIRVYDRIPADIYSVVRRQDRGEGHQTATFDIDILNPAGEVLAEIEGYTIKQVQAWKPAGMYYEKRHGTRTLCPHPMLPGDFAGRACITGEGEIADRLLERIRSQYGRVLEISGGEMHSREEYQRLGERLTAEKVGTVIHLASLTEREIDTKAELDEAGERGFTVCIPCWTAFLCSISPGT
ncbi:type I polyketide synthase [Paenibacillus sp. HW567]|uniref:type I polyketide synthase n=1 Tax=Paenibacillus sp. HW567 TaxID=1034769 RepID=UPI00036BA74E|nr:beta-ketoacyl synthase N-terminal-like domain-containing protein [Paenibacillus sp. HW567]